MKKILVLSILAAAMILFMSNCKKQAVNTNKPAFTHTETIELGKCTSSANGKNFLICCDSVSEQRCPIGLACLNPGHALVTFSFQQNGTIKHFSLATIVNIEYRKDTTINQIKISLKNVLPYPDYFYPSSAPKQAVIEITE